MPVSFAERAADRRSAGPQRPGSAKSGILKKSDSRGASRGAEESLSPEQLLQSVVVKPLTEWASSLFSHGADAEESQDVQEEEHDDEGEQREVASKPRNVLTMTCTDETSTVVKNIQICPHDSFEDFIDLIKNEFGNTLWPVFQDPHSGKRLLVINDDKFDQLCEETIAEGGRIKVLVYKKIEAQEYEL